jgi:hypothetical protein
MAPVARAIQSLKTSALEIPVIVIRRNLSGKIAAATAE